MYLLLRPRNSYLDLLLSSEDESRSAFGEVHVTTVAITINRLHLSLQLEIYRLHTGALIGLLGPALSDEGGNVLGAFLLNLGTDTSLANHLLVDARRGLSKGFLAKVEHFPHEDGKRVNVGFQAVGLHEDIFGSHVDQCSRLPGQFEYILAVLVRTGGELGGQLLRKSKIKNFHVSAYVKTEILRLEIAVDDAVVFC